LIITVERFDLLRVALIAMRSDVNNTDLSA